MPLCISASDAAALDICLIRDVLFYGWCFPSRCRLIPALPSPIGREKPPAFTSAACFSFRVPVFEGGGGLPIFNAAACASRPRRRF